MYLVITKHTRPSLDVEFYTFKQSTRIQPEVREYFLTTYIYSGKVVHNAWEQSEDGLSTTSQAFWLSKAVYEEFLNDPIILSDYIPDRDAYTAEFGLTREIISEEEI